MTESQNSAMSSKTSHTYRLNKLRKKDTRPNILLIMTDQQRSDTIHAAGAEFMQTPNLDALIKGGRLYSNAYSPNPICMPARHNMLTGLPARYHGYPDNCWVFGLPSGLPTFPEILSDNGYESRTIGKNHFYPPRRHNGYLNMELMQEVPAYREQDEYLEYLHENGLGHVLNIHGVRNLLYMVPQQSQIPEKHHGTTWVTNRAIDFIEKNNGRHPWLLKLGYIAPHPPFDVPKEYTDLYTGKNIPKPHISKTTLSSLAEESKLLGDLPTTEYVQRMRELYYAAISHIDANIGKLISSLKETHQFDNTLIVFTSDHGGMLGDYGTYQKWLPYDSCSKIPLILHFPKRIKSGEICEDFVDLNDVLPTILDASNLEYSGKHTLPGESLLSSTQIKNRDLQYIEYSSGNRRWISMRNREYKYNYYFGGGREELFNLEIDPNECFNLMESSLNEKDEAEKEKLKLSLISYETKWGLPGTIENNSFIVLEPYVPNPYRNSAFPIFQEKLMKKDDRNTMNHHFDEIISVIKDESVVNLSDLDLKNWQVNGNYSSEEIDTLLEKERDNRAYKLKTNSV